MVELVIITLIIGIAALAGLPMLNGVLDHSRLKGATEEVVNALQYAQMSAMKSGRQTRVEIKEGGNIITVEHIQMFADLFNGGDKLAESAVEDEQYYPMGYPLKKGFDYIIDLDDEDRFKGVNITQTDFQAANKVYFDTLGSPSHGGTATLALGNFLMVVTLDDLTGKVTVSD